MIRGQAAGQLNASIRPWQRSSRSRPTTASLGQHRIATRKISCLATESRVGACGIRATLQPRTFDRGRVSEMPPPLSFEASTACGLPCPVWKAMISCRPLSPGGWSR